MIKFLLSVLTMFFFFISNCQIEELLENVVLIQSKDKNLSGSGFLYHTGNNVYLMTAKHVLLRTNNSLLFDEIVFYSYPKNAQKEIAVEYTINLKDAFNTHKVRYGNEFDMIAIRLGKTMRGVINYFDFVSRKGKMNKINIFSLNECILKLDSINIGDEIYLIGYPKSLEVAQHNNFNFNRPLARKGIISGKDYDHNTILIDCPSYGGNSGGPVLLKRNNEIKMIGLVSSYVPYIDFWINPVTKITNKETSNSGLTVVVPFYRIIMDLYQEQLWD